MPTFVRRDRMTALARAVKRVLRGPRRGIPRPPEGHVSLVCDEAQLARAAYLLALYTARHPSVLQSLLSSLWNLSTTTLFIQIEEISAPAELVVARCSGQRIAVAGSGLNVTTETYEPAPDGAYLVHRQYRHLGLYENPPVERVVVLLRIVARSGPRFVVNVPHYVSHVSVVDHGRVVGDTILVPERDELRFNLGPGNQ